MLGNLKNNSCISICFEVRIVVACLGREVVCNVNCLGGGCVSFKIKEKFEPRGSFAVLHALGSLMLLPIS